MRSLVFSVLVLTTACRVEPPPPSSEVVAPAPGKGPVATQPFDRQVEAARTCARDLEMTYRSLDVLVMSLAGSDLQVLIDGELVPLADYLREEKCKDFTLRHTRFWARNCCSPPPVIELDPAMVPPDDDLAQVYLACTAECIEDQHCCLGGGGCGWYEDEFDGDNPRPCELGDTACCEAEYDACAAGCSRSSPHPPFRPYCPPAQEEPSGTVIVVPTPK